MQETEKDLIFPPPTRLQLQSSLCFLLHLYTYINTILQQYLHSIQKEHSVANTCEMMVFSVNCKLCSNTKSRASTRRRQSTRLMMLIKQSTYRLESVLKKICSNVIIRLAQQNCIIILRIPRSFVFEVGEPESEGPASQQKTQKDLVMV